KKGASQTYDTPSFFFSYKPKDKKKKVKSKEQKEGMQKIPHLFQDAGFIITFSIYCYTKQFYDISLS
ncbi:hypothetical protein DW917_16045, partial [Prevotella sp. AM42-24]|uniref:hypothetical protein n=1 Tax=Prevotella sp. AM42-24 TaxID=2293125 RepID=UPI000E8ECF4E